MDSRRSFLLKSFALTGLSLSCRNETLVPLEPEPQPDFAIRFAVCSDGHYGQVGTDYVAIHNNLVEWLNLEKAKCGLTLAVFNGDMIHDNAKFLPEVKKMLDKLEMQYYVTRGNHDRVSHDFWRKCWGYPTNHVFSTDFYGFVLIDTSNERGDYLPPNLAWLEEQLDAFQQKKKIFVFMHISQGSWNGDVVKASDTMRLLDSCDNVSAIFHGHEHEKDYVKMSGKKPYIFDGRFGGNWGVPYQGYRIVEIGKEAPARTYQFDPLRQVVVNETIL